MCTYEGLTEQDAVARAVYILLRHGQELQRMIFASKGQLDALSPSSAPLPPLTALEKRFLAVVNAPPPPAPWQPARSGLRMWFIYRSSEVTCHLPYSSHNVTRIHLLRSWTPWYACVGGKWGPINPVAAYRRFSNTGRHSACSARHRTRAAAAAAAAFRAILAVTSHLFHLWSK